ncbi:zinc ribbon domain-containing protein [Pseudenhygromyxa sp. WMMC2535]|uniref:zinc ribbon domain-containing protein n=1 Tax=Pseudenhygromyxa sp. WMMC2535 TaxID=2712867 RepID=UPI0015951110|nr:zinc ribbon domain-containing protein [Pseudenhygromyxa sp. WMMC2535]NVB38820.1 zinc ribbon domain-containing protein [Pseudenhygromyxa sp. WMMC2535]
MLGAEANPKDVTLPPPEERRWLIQQTAALLAEGGWHRYVRGPLLEPTPHFFPDAWAGGERSVARVLRRLLRYAGHEAAEISLTIHPQDPARRAKVVAKPPVMRGQDPIAWFIPGAKAPLRFAVEEAALREPENLVPALARAVAHAHRAASGMATPEGAEGQRLIDLTSFALGFGLLTTDASQRFYAKSAGGFKATRAQSRLGVLSVQDMSFLLALQAEARGLERRERRRLLAHLQPNQAGFFRQAATWMAGLEPSIRERLGLPEPASWPAAPDLATLAGPLELPDAPEGAETDADAETDDDDEPEERLDLDRGIRDANRGKAVFRVERSGALRMAKVLGFPVLMLGGLLSRGNFGVDIPMEIVMPSAAGLAVAGLAIGSLFTDRRCSEPKCGNKLRPDDETCPLCGGQVMGVIHSPKERLGAEEALVRAGKIDEHGLLVGWQDEQDEDEEYEDEEYEYEEDEDEEDEDGAAKLVHDAELAPLTATRAS